MTARQNMMTGGVLVIATLAIVASLIVDGSSSPPGSVTVVSAARSEPDVAIDRQLTKGSSAPSVDELKAVYYGGQVRSYDVKLSSGANDSGGLRDGDRIISVANEPLSNFSVADRISNLVRIGDIVVVERDGKTLRFTYGYPDL